jgi:hypothetical protein
MGDTFSQEREFWNKSRFGILHMFIKYFWSIYYVLVKEYRICYGDIRIILG